MSMPRRAFRGATRMLAAATVMILAGCGSFHLSTDSLQSLSDLPHKDQAMLKVADASRDAGDCAAAIRFYRLAGESNPKDEIAARIGAAGCEFATGALSESERDYRAAIAAAPEDATAYVGLGRIFLVQHHPEEALAYFDLALKKGARSGVLWNDRGIALDQLRRHREAQQSYRTGLGQYAADSALRNNLALSLAMTGGFAEAENLLRALAGEPGATSRTRENLALVLGLAGDDDAAREASHGDLDDAALDNNRRFYDYARTLIAVAPPPVRPTKADAAGDRTSPIAAQPLPLPAVATKQSAPAGGATASLATPDRTGAQPPHGRRDAHRTHGRTGAGGRHVVERLHRNRALHHPHAAAARVHRQPDRKARAAGAGAERQTSRQHPGVHHGGTRLVDHADRSRPAS